MELYGMMIFRGGTALVLAGVLCCASCGDSQSTTGDKKQPAATAQHRRASRPTKQGNAEPKRAQPKLVTREIARLGVKVDLPETARIYYPTGRGGHVRVQRGTCVAILERRDSTFALEVELATKGKVVFERHSGKMATYWAPKVSSWILKKELGNGFELEYETAGATQSQIVIRRRVGNRQIRCTLDFLSRDATCVRPICYGLRPSK
jgi:hypothetical protein